MTWYKGKELRVKQSMFCVDAQPFISCLLLAKAFNLSDTSFLVYKEKCYLNLLYSKLTVRLKCHDVYKGIFKLLKKCKGILSMRNNTIIVLVKVPKSLTIPILERPTVIMAIY